LAKQGTRLTKLAHDPKGVRQRHFGLELPAKAPRRDSLQFNPKSKI
jgi:hypothetical protein